MTQNKKCGDGALFKNDKQGVEKRPDYTGTATIHDRKFYLSAWLTVSKSGQRYMSLAFNEAQAKPGDAASQNSSEATTSIADDDDIPF